MLHTSKHVFNLVLKWYKREDPGSSGAKNTDGRPTERYDDTGKFWRDR